MTCGLLAVPQAQRSPIRSETPLPIWVWIHGVSVAQPRVTTERSEGLDPS